MGKTYRHIAQGKTNRFYANLRGLGRKEYYEYRSSDDYKRDKEAMNGSLPKKYNNGKWNHGYKSEWRIDGLLRKEKALKEQHDKEMNPYIYPSISLEEWWPVWGSEEPVEYQGEEYWVPPGFDIVTSICWEDWYDNDMDYPHKKRKRKSRAYYHLRKAFKKPWVNKLEYYGDKPENKKIYNIITGIKPGDCVHNWKTTYTKQYDWCEKCKTFRYLKPI